jgi:hypothetical protein
MFGRTDTTFLLITSLASIGYLLILVVVVPSTEQVQRARRMRTRDNTPRRRDGTTAAYGPTSEVLGLADPGPSGAERDDAQSPGLFIAGLLR